MSLFAQHRLEHRIENFVSWQTAQVMKKVEGLTPFYTMLLVWQAWCFRVQLRRVVRKASVYRHEAVGWQKLCSEVTENRDLLQLRYAYLQDIVADQMRKEFVKDSGPMASAKAQSSGYGAGTKTNEHVTSIELLSESLQKATGKATKQQLLRQNNQ